MKHHFLAFFFSFLLLTIIAMPTVLVSLGNVNDTILVLDWNEEDNTEKESSKKLQLVLCVENYLDEECFSFKRNTYSNYIGSLYTDFSIELNSPPPEIL